MIFHYVNQFAGKPKRIVSLVPSQTELLHYLGLEQETVGITQFCVHPVEWFKLKPKIGGTKTLNKEIIDRLAPELIIANKEENIKEQVEALAVDYPVWVTDVNNAADALNMIKDIGCLTSTADKATALVAEIRKRFNSIVPIPALLKFSTAVYQLKTAYLIWRKPYMAAGGNTFINDMLCQCGFNNVFENQKRYPKIKVNDLKTFDCELLLLSSEPYPFKQQHIDELQFQLPKTKIVLVNGEMFSWYGSRLLLAPGYLNKLINSIS